MTTQEALGAVGGEWWQGLCLKELRQGQIVPEEKGQPCCGRVVSPLDCEPTLRLRWLTGTISGMFLDILKAPSQACCRFISLDICYGCWFKWANKKNNCPWPLLFPILCFGALDFGSALRTIVNERREQWRKLTGIEGVLGQIAIHFNVSLVPPRGSDNCDHLGQSNSTKKRRGKVEPGYHGEPCEPPILDLLLMMLAAKRKHMSIWKAWETHSSSALPWTCSLPVLMPTPQGTRASPKHKAHLSPG